MPNARHEPGLYRPVADINVTPLVDVMLVLLIIFMVTAPLLTTGVKVNLPTARSAPPLSQKDPIVVSISKDGRLVLGSDEVKLEQLVDLIRVRLESDPSQSVHIRGDRDTTYGEIVNVMDVLIGGGIAKIAMVTDRRKPKTAADQR